MPCHHPARGRPTWRPEPIILADKVEVLHGLQRERRPTWVWERAQVASDARGERSHAKLRPIVLTLSAGKRSSYRFVLRAVADSAVVLLERDLLERARTSVLPSVLYW